MTRHAQHGIAQTRNWFIAIIFLIVITMLVRSVVSSVDKVKVSKAGLREIEQKYGEMYERQSSVESVLSEFEDNFGFEKYVRENFGVVRPGEKVVIILSNKNSSNNHLNSLGSQE